MGQMLNFYPVGSRGYLFSLPRLLFLKGSREEKHSFPRAFGARSFKPAGSEIEPLDPRVPYLLTQTKD